MKMKKMYWLVALAMAGALNASASMIWTIEQVGADVVVSTAGGSLNLTGLTYQFDYPIPANNAISSFYGPWARFGNISADGATLPYYNGFTLDNQLSSSVELYATSTSGEHYFFQDNMFCLPEDSGSGATLGAASMTFANTTLSAMSLSDGEYASWSWAGDSMTITVGAVPEPASVMMIGLGGLLIAGYRRFFGRA